MNKDIIKKYLEQVFRGILIGFGLSIGITFGIVGIYAFNLTTVTSGTPLTATLWNNTMNTITGSIQTLENSVVTLTGDQTIAGTKTFSILPISSGSPTQTGQLANKGYVDTVVSAAGGGSCDGTFLNIKFTHNTYTANLGGKSGGDDKCSLEYPGYHMCDSNEVGYAGKEGCLPNIGSYYGVSGHYHVTSATNCSGWTLDTGSETIYWLTTSQYTPTFTTGGGLTSCGGIRSIACCK